MKLQYLGVGSAIDTINYHVSYLIDDRFLIDCPPLSPTILRQQGFDLSKIELIYISHLHGDHYFGLPFFIIEQLLLSRKTPLKIFGPLGLEQNIKKLVELAFPSLEFTYLINSTNTVFLNLLDIENETSLFKYNPKCIKVNHNIETYGLTISSNNKRIFITSDTEYFEGIEEIIQNNDYCIIDACTSGKKIPYHFSLEQVEEIAKKFPDIQFSAIHRSNYRTESEIPNIIFPNDFDYILI